MLRYEQWSLPCWSGCSWWLTLSTWQFVKSLAPVSSSESSPTSNTINTIHRLLHVGPGGTFFQVRLNISSTVNLFMLCLSIRHIIFLVSTSLIILLVYYSLNLSNYDPGLDINLLQSVAICCNLLQSASICCNLLQSVKICCNLLQSVAMSFNIVQFGLIYYNQRLPHLATGCHWLPLVATCCHQLPPGSDSCQYISI